ncbi:MAG: hypothetical protein IPO90_14520 [Flavobacteriales bacterium]|nr:hypothetical protein [Flavobacteriales bacterium]
MITDRVNPVPAAGTATSTLNPRTMASSPAANTAEPSNRARSLGPKGWTLAADLGLDVAAVAGCAGDINSDGLINSTDFGLFVGAFNGTCY